jgi:hypothetical protein
MVVKICDKGKGYEYKKMNWIRIENGELIINYQDKNNETCEEFGDIPEYLFVGEKEKKNA